MTPPRRSSRLACLFAAATAALSAATTACTPAPEPVAHPESVAIGLLAPATGTGADAVRGAQLAAEVVNNPYPDLPIPLAAPIGMPGLGGAALILITGDTAGSSDQAQERANELVDRGVVGLIALDSADVVADLGAQTQRLRLPLLDAASTADYIPELGLEWYFRTTPTDRTLVEAGFALLRQQLPAARPGRLVLLQDADGSMAAGVALVREEAERAGYPIVATIDLPRQGADAAEIARQVDLTAASVALAIVADAASAKTATEVAARVRGTIPVLGVGYGFDALAPLPVSDVDSSSAVVLRAAAWSADFAARSPTAVAVSALYERRYGARMSDAAAKAFTATITLAAAIDTAGSAEPARIRAALRQLWVPATQTIMPWNGVRFGANGQNQLAAAVVEARVPGGYQVVFPRELATVPMVWASASGVPA